jgi:hypothetical protein
MTSAFAWLDHSEEQRRQILDVLDLFREKSTVDELGLGTIRDAFTNMLLTNWNKSVIWVNLQILESKRGQRASQAALTS